MCSVPNPGLKSGATTSGVPNGTHCLPQSRRLDPILQGWILIHPPSHQPIESHRLKTYQLFLAPVFFFSRSAFIRSGDTPAGLSFESWGTSFPSNAFFKMLWRRTSAGISYFDNIRSPKVLHTTSTPSNSFSIKFVLLIIIFRYFLGQLFHGAVKSTCQFLHLLRAVCFKLFFCFLNGLLL